MASYPYYCSRTAPPELAQLIATYKFQLGELAVAAVKFQLDESKKLQNGKDGPGAGIAITSLFDTVASKVQDLIGIDDTNLVALEQCEDSVLRRALGQWDKLPYPAWLTLRKRQVSLRLQQRDAEPKIDQPEPKRRKLAVDEGQEEDVDEWIIRNERAIRDAMYQQHVEEERQRTAGTGLVRLSGHAGTAFPTSTITTSGMARKVIREEVDGFKLLDAKRATFVYIQPSVAAYAETFESMTHGIFNGLNWSNVVVAGGMALGALLCVEEPDSPHKEEHWVNSDVDVYIYGLGPVAANDKIRHLYDTFKANIPAGQNTLVVRNSKTISFLSQYPIRRVQIILKAVRHPKEVLLNFDLDICAVAYDGNEVWMLPRAARALETGYNVFTMDMVQGHYLGDRRATQEQRVFKYATKGYGLRFLPSYVSSYHAALAAPTGPFEQSASSSPRTLDHLVLRGHRWTKRVVKGFEECRQTFLRRQSKNRERARKRGLEVNSNDEGGFPLKLSHSSIDIRTQQTWEPAARTCLSGFELFMRHVALWEGDLAGKWNIHEDKWNSSIYPDGLGGYDDSPKYKWDETFRFSDFTKAIDDYNRKLKADFVNALDDSDWEGCGYLNDNQPPGRMTYGNTVDEVLQPRSNRAANSQPDPPGYSPGDLSIPLIIPAHFYRFAKELLEKVFEDHGVPGKADEVLYLHETQEIDCIEEVFIRWNITPFTMWQQVDRRIDEIHEALWAFQRSGPPTRLTETARRVTFCTEVSRRSYRLPREDELRTFGQWAYEKPLFHYSVNAYDVLFGVLWGEESDEDRQYQSDYKEDGDL